MNLIFVSEKELTEVTAIRVFITDTLNRPEPNSIIVTNSPLKMVQLLDLVTMKICHNLCHLNDDQV